MIDDYIITDELNNENDIEMKDFKDIKIAVAGIGYVGLSIVPCWRSITK